ncbi:hypothetical protein C8R47DRAFT_1209741 [Mycena vitilis]|nr:hypothetical protein C8R47DRAFT_1209741 [Mycena vitilis]
MFDPHFQDQLMGDATTFMTCSRFLSVLNISNMQKDGVTVEPRRAENSTSVRPLLPL